MADIPQLKKLATDGPFLQLTDGRLQIELGEAYMRTRFWAIGDRIRVEPESDCESFSHTLINIDVPGYDDPVPWRNGPRDTGLDLPSNCHPALHHQLSYRRRGTRSTPRAWMWSLYSVGS